MGQETSKPAIQSYTIEKNNDLPYVKHTTTFTTQTPGFDDRALSQREMLAGCFDKKPEEIDGFFKQHIKTGFTTMKELLDYHTPLEEKLTKIFRNHSIINVTSLNGLELLYHQISNKSGGVLKPFHTNLVWKSALFKHLAKFKDQIPDPVVVVYMPKEDYHLEMPDKIQFIEFEILPGPQDPRKPCVNAGDPKFGGGFKGAGMAAEESSLIPTSLMFCDLASLPEEHPLHVSFILNGGYCEQKCGNDFSETPGVFVVDKHFDLNSPYCKPMVFSLAEDNDDLMNELAPKIKPYKQWYLNFAMPNLAKTRLTKEVINASVYLMFRAYCLNLNALKNDPDFKDSISFQTMLIGTGVFRWPVPAIGVMSKISMSAAVQATGITEYKPVIATFNEAQAKQVQSAVPFEHVFQNVDRSIMVDRLYDYTVALNKQMEFQRKGQKTEVYYENDQFVVR